MITIELEVSTNAFQIELNDSQFILVYSKDDEDVYTLICWFDFENQQLEDAITLEPADYKGKMIGWSKIPYYNTILKNDRLD